MLPRLPDEFISACLDVAGSSPFGSISRWGNTDSLFARPVEHGAAPAHAGEERPSPNPPTKRSLTSAGFADDRAGEARAESIAPKRSEEPFSRGRDPESADFFSRRAVTFHKAAATNRPNATENPQCTSSSTASPSSSPLPTSIAPKLLPRPSWHRVRAHRERRRSGLLDNHDRGRHGAGGLPRSPNAGHYARRRVQPAGRRPGHSDRKAGGC